MANGNGKLPTPGVVKAPKMAPAPKVPTGSKGTVRGMPNMARATTPRVPKVPKV